MNKDEEGVVINTQRDEDEGEVSQLVGHPNVSTKRTDNNKWDGEEEVPTKGGPIMHVDKRLKDALMDADQEREKELLELKEHARNEERAEVEDLMSKAQPAVPAGWDYLTLPRKINLLRVKTPPTIMQDDYFKPVKSLVST